VRFIGTISSPGGHQQAERRPVIIVSADPYNESRSPLIGIVPLTKSIAKNPVHLKLGKDETGLAADSTALVDQALDIVGPSQQFADERRPPSRLLCTSQTHRAPFYGRPPGVYWHQSLGGKPSRTPKVLTIFSDCP
jgi:hypothetical protein